MNRVDIVLKNANLAKDYLVARVDRKNIQAVLDLEKTAIVTKPENVTEKNIIIVCENQVVAVARIKDVKEYENNKYSHIWKSDNDPNSNSHPWKSLVAFDNVIQIGGTLEEIFGSNSKIKYVQTVMTLNDIDEFEAIKNVIITSYTLRINQYLSNLGFI